ncbi:MAG: cytochrome oxidase, partial [Rudaea sp.]
RKAAHTSSVLRRWLFGALLLIFFGGSYATLSQFPIPPQDAPLDVKQVVNVRGQQWSWQIEPSTVSAGSPVEFRVTSKDVNHGFAIYAPDGLIVTQTQAMPGFTNKIVHTFTQPGTYKVMCLEYCGLGHAPMTSEFTVVAASGG